MREILESGVTGILVSHSLSQVRDLCNKILWLDHGNQIAFTDETQLYLDAYEEFLHTKQLPKSREDIEELAKAFEIRKSAEQKKKERTETQRLQAILEAGDSDAAIQAALNIIKKSKPELLKPKQNTPPPKKEKVEYFKRISGKDRYEVSFKLADNMKGNLGIDKFDTVILTDGYVFANALSGSYLAKKHKAPLLFVDTDNIVMTMEYVSSNLNDYGNIYVIGEINGLSDDVISNYSSSSVIRIGGENIYEINLNSLKYMDSDTDRILVCTGENFADSISAIATGLPILMVRDTLSDSQINLIHQYKIKMFSVIGGTIAVNEIVEEELKQYGEVERIKGRTRYDTSAVIAAEFFKGASSVVITSGKILTDSFCSGIYAANTGIPMLLADRWKTDACRSYVQRNKINNGIVIGAEDILSDLTAKNIFSPEKKD